MTEPTNWVLRGGEARELLAMPLPKEQAFCNMHFHLLYVTTPGGGKRFVREYLEAFLAFLEGRAPIKGLAHEFSKTSEAREISRPAAKNFRSLVREHTKRGRISMTSTVELLCLSPSTPHTWDKSDLRFHETDHTFDAGRFLAMCVWNRPRYS